MKDPVESRTVDLEEPGISRSKPVRLGDSLRALRKELVDANVLFVADGIRGRNGSTIPKTDLYPRPGI